MTVKLGCGICDARWEIGTPRTCKCNQQTVGYKFKGEAVKNSIAFLAGSEPPTQVLRLSCEGITANPDIPVDEAAKAVLDALDANIKVMVQKAVEAERDACAKVCEERSKGWDKPRPARDETEGMMWYAAKHEARALGEAIRARRQE